MTNWPKFKDHPQSVLVAVDGSGKRTYHVSLDEQQYNQARDAIAFCEMTIKLYPHVSAYIEERIAKPQPTGDL